MSEIYTTKVTSKGQATIPQDIRELLRISAGDQVLFIVRGDEVILKKVEGTDYAYLAALQKTLSEWETREDEEAYGDL
jgi:antitoxin PrlF